MMCVWCNFFFMSTRFILLTMLLILGLIIGFVGVCEVEPAAPVTPGPTKSTTTKAPDVVEV